jgi:hypothetical protein
MKIILRIINRIGSLCNFIFNNEPVIKVNNTVIKFKSNGDVLVKVSNNLFVDYNLGFIGTDIQEAQELIKKSTQNNMSFKEYLNDVEKELLTKDIKVKGCGGCNGQSKSS